jgi:glycerophosphoryl diester phosphodiesterase
LRGETDLPVIQLLAAAGAPWDLAGNGQGGHGGITTYDDLASPDGLAEIATWADGIGPDKRRIVPLGSNGRLGPPTSLVDDAHRAGLLVHPWTFRCDAPFLAPEYPGPEAEIERFLELGVDGIFTDFPDVGVRARERRRAS